MNSNLFVVSKYALPYLGYTFAAFIVLTVLDFEALAFLSAVLLVGFVWVFRNPERELKVYDETAIVAPCDGVVSHIEEISTDRGKYRYKIEIQTSYMDVGILRYPLSGKVHNFTHIHGARLSQSSKKFKTLNEHLSYEIVQSPTNSVMLEHYLQKGCFPLFSEINTAIDAIKSKRYGYALPGITTVYLQSNVRLNIHVNDKLKAVEDIIAYSS